MLSRQQLQDLPKVELHFHLEGSIRLSTIVELSKRLNVVVPGVGDDSDDLQPYRTMFCCATKMGSLFEFINKFWHIQSLLCSEDILERISYECVVDSYRNGVRLLEIRYSPTFIAASKYIDHSHMTFDSIHTAILAGIARAQNEFDIQVGLIGTLDRSVDVEIEEKVLDFFLNNSTTVVGLDIANDERCSCIPFAPLYQRASGILGLTCHAGEATIAESVRDSVNYLKVTRIGHGFRALQDDDVVALLLEKNVLLEICPLSNVLTGSVESIAAHPIRELVTRGVKVCINSDDPGVFDINLVDEYEQLVLHHNFTEAEFLQCNINALNASFLPADKVAYVRSKYFS